MMASSGDPLAPLELEAAASALHRVEDRPRLAEPLPVRLCAVNDVALPAPAGVESRLEAFYADLLGFERIDSAGEFELTYRADNFVLRFHVEKRPVEHPSLRPTGIEVPSLGLLAEQLAAREIPFVRQRGLTLGAESVVLLDPAGNWVELSESRHIG